MATKLTSVLGIVLVALFASCYQCPDFEYFVETTWTVENAPANDTLRVGDTLWVSSEFKNELVDINTKALVRLENNTIPFKVGPSECYRVDSQLGSKYDRKDNVWENFDLVKNNQIVDIRKEMYYLYELQNSMYKIRFGYIPKKSGIYFITANAHTRGYYQACKRCKYNVDIYREIAPKYIQNAVRFYSYLDWTESSPDPFQNEGDANRYFFVVK